MIRKMETLLLLFPLISIALFMIFDSYSFAGSDADLGRSRKEASRQLSTQEMETDKYLRSIWKQMCDALSKGDIEKALAFFTEKAQPQYRQALTGFSKGQLEEISKDLRNIELEQFLGSGSAYYDIIGKGAHGSLQFEKDFNGEWKIRFF